MRKSAVFILSHGRADNVYTDKTLRRCGYTGDIYFICDDLDNDVSQYRKNFENVIVFDKREAAKVTDSCVNSGKLNSVVFARNQCHRIAKDLGLTHFVEMDDDYTNFSFRFPSKTEGLTSKVIKNLDKVFDSYFDFLDVSKAKTVSFSQGGELQGGVREFHLIAVKRKAMNVFFCRTDRPFKFLGLMNDDVNMYLQLNQIGELVLQLGVCSVKQLETQQNASGLTDMYQENGTYYKSFMSFMMFPSCVKLHTIGFHKRIHHLINYRYNAPKIIREKWNR